MPPCDTTGHWPPTEHRRCAHRPPANWESMHPPGLRETVHQLLEEWLDLQQDNPVDNRQQGFVTRLHSAGLLKVRLLMLRSVAGQLRATCRSARLLMPNPVAMPSLLLGCWTSADPAAT